MDFDYTKIIWGIFIAGYLVMQWLGRKKVTPPNNEEAQEEAWQEWQKVFDIEREEESKQETIEQPLNRPQTRAKVAKKHNSDRVAPVVAPVPEGKSAEVEPTESRKDFNLRDAVIMSEILNPKFKDE